LRGWHFSRSQPKVCMIMLYTFMGRPGNRNTAVRFTSMERKQSTIRRLLEKHQNIYPWSKSHKV
ncbi:unnamed protein product, partial [Brassica oleracea]